MDSVQMVNWFGVGRAFPVIPSSWSHIESQSLDAIQDQSY